MICPNCGAESKYLAVYVKEYNRYYVNPMLLRQGTNKVSLDWSSAEIVEGTEEKFDVECINCNEVLGEFTSINDVGDFIESLIKETDD